MRKPRTDGRPENILTPAEVEIARRIKQTWHQKARSLNLTQNKFARKWGLTQPAVSNFINGYMKPHVEIVLKFATSLEVDPSHLDHRMTKLLHVKKPATAPFIELLNDDFAPRITKGDRVTIDYINPRPGKLCIMYDISTLIIGTYQGDTLRHLVTNDLIPINDRAVHPITTIIPKEAL